MTNTTTTKVLLSPKQLLRAGNIESQKDGDANMLDSSIVLLAGSINGAKMRASGPVANGESGNR